MGIEMLHDDDMEDVVSIAPCGCADKGAHDVAACNNGASFFEVMEENADDDVRSLGSCEQEEDEEDLIVTNHEYSQVAATCIGAALQNGFDTKAAHVDEEEEV